MILININHLKKNYTRGKKQFPVVNDFSFKASEGDLAVLCGKSGSGKSTILAMLGGYLEADDGEVILNGKLITNMKEKELDEYHRQIIAYLPQSNAMFQHLTVLENILVKFLVQRHSEVDLESIKKHAMELLELFELGNEANDFPKELSGGEIRRVAIIRTILEDKQLYLLDEPSTGLDERMTRKLMEYLKELINNQKIVIVASHDSLVKEYATQSILL